MKNLYMTLHRERNLMRFSEKNDLKDAVPVTEEEAVKILCSHSYSESYAISFIENVKKNPYNDWIQW